MGKDPGGQPLPQPSPPRRPSCPRYTSGNTLTIKWKGQSAARRGAQCNYTTSHYCAPSGPKRYLPAKAGQQRSSSPVASTPKSLLTEKQRKNGAPLTSPQEGDLKQPAYPQVFKCGIPSWTGHKLMYRVWGPWEQSRLPFPGLMARKVYLVKRCLPEADSGRRGNMLRNF